MFPVVKERSFQTQLHYHFIGTGTDEDTMVVSKALLEPPF
jgi:hypothetical protein